jgi:flagellar biosynthesis chaperone FliJ
MTPKTLSRTLAIKERMRQWRRAELHEAESRVVEAQTSLESEAERHAGAAALITRPGEFSAGELALHSEQIEKTTRAMKEAEAQLVAREEERELRRGEVGEATREVRAIEALRTRLVTEQRRVADQREQRELDEASARKGRSQ